MGTYAKNSHSVANTCFYGIKDEPSQERLKKAGKYDVTS